MHILQRQYLHIKHDVGLPPTIHMLYFILFKSSKSENSIVELSNLKNLSFPYQGSNFYVRVSTRAGICLKFVVVLVLESLVAR